MNIFVNSPSYDIEDPKDGDTYYFDNSKHNIKVVLVDPSVKIRITLCLLYEYENNVTIETSKGNYILDRNIQELVMIYDNYWNSIGENNLIPFLDNTFKQELKLNLYNFSQIGSNIIIANERGSTAGQDGKYKMSNLIFTGAPNYHSSTTSNGEGGVIVYKISDNRFFSETIITEGYDQRNGNYQGSFGKHVKLLDMGDYDLLIVSAPTKVKNNQPFRTVLDDVFGYIYIYSYRKNKYGEFYFHRETRIQLPSIRITKNFETDIIDDYLPHGTIFQIETLKNTGILIYYVSKILYLYDLRDMNNIVIESNSILRPEFIKIFDSDVYFSYENEIIKVPYVSNLWTDPSSVIITNTFNVENFGSMLYPHTEGIAVVSSNDFFDFDTSYQLRKRITFGPKILSFDIFERENTRKFFFLLDGTENNLHVFDKEYRLILNDIYKEFEDDFPRLVRADRNGETIFMGISNHNDVDNGVSSVGLVANYDVFFERKDKNLSSLFPDFEIFNHVLVEEKTLNYKKHFYLEETFKNILPLVSNRTNNKKNVEEIYPVINDTGIVMELNYDVSNGSFLSKYAKYFIYTNPTHSSLEYSYLLNSSNLYLAWLDNQSLSYNNSGTQNEIHVYKKNNKINLVLLGIGTSSTSINGSNKRWNIIESEMTQDPSQNYYDISMSFYDNLDMLQFVQFKKFTHHNDLIFLVHNLHSITIIDYFTKNIHTKTFTRGILNDLFYIDSLKNLFHLYSQMENNTEVFYLTIYKHGSQYQSIVLDSAKLDITKRPYEIAAQYYDRAFVLLENYSDLGGTIVVRRFDIKQELLEKIEFEEINISNEFNVNKHIVDIEFVRDTIKKVVLVNKTEKDDKIFQKTSQKIYTLPRILKTKYQSFDKKYIRQLMVKEKNYVNYEQYQINDEPPNVFYNIEFQKYFKNNIGIYANYQFLDNKDLFGVDDEKLIQLVKQNERSFSKYTFRPQNQHEFKTHLYDKENNLVIVTAKGLTGPTSYLEIFDVSATSYVIQPNGEVTGISLRKKVFDKGVCYETLDKRQDIYISEEYDPSTQSIKFWTFSKDNHFTPTSNEIQITLSGNQAACFHRTLSQEFVMDILLNHKIVYFQKSGPTFIQKVIDLPNDIVIEEPFDINVVSESFFILVNPKMSYLFVKNQNPAVNEWKYFGEQIYKLDALHENTLELERYYFVDVDVSNNNLQLLQNTNINIQSPIFYDAENRFYCIQDNGFYKISSSNLQELLTYHTISSDGSTIYSQRIGSYTTNVMSTQRHFNGLDGCFVNGNPIFYILNNGVYIPYTINPGYQVIPDGITIYTLYNLYQYQYKYVLPPGNIHRFSVAYGTTYETNTYVFPVGTIRTYYNNDITVLTRMLLNLPHSNKDVISQDASSIHFSPNLYTNLNTDINNLGYFTLTSDGLGVTKKNLYQPTKSRTFNTVHFPLIDIYNSVYIYESPNLNLYKINNNQYVLDSSKNVTNFELPIDSDETFITNSNFLTMMYKEISFAEEKQFLNSILNNIPMEIRISPDAKEFLIYQGYTLHLFKEDITNYPNKYRLIKSMIPSNDFKYEMDHNVISSMIKVDWERQRVFNAYGTVDIFTDPSGTTGSSDAILPRISIFTWDPNSSEYEFHSDICGNRSFGYLIELSKDGNTLYISEPKAPASNGYQEGKIHIYDYNSSLDQFVFNKTLRSQKSKIGFLMKISPSMDKIATFGHQIGVEEMELVIFYNMKTTPVEISIKANVFDMVFMGNTESLFVEENIFYEETNKTRSFYLIEQVNECPNIITKVIIPNILFSDEQIMFKLIPFGHDYILFDAPEFSHIVRIRDYMMSYIATQLRSLNSKLVISSRGDTVINVKEDSGQFIIYGSW